MKKNLLKLIMLTVMLVSNLVVFAQTTPPVQPPKPVEDPDAIPASIDGMLIYLAVAGVLFSIYYISKVKNRQVQA